MTTQLGQELQQFGSTSDDPDITVTETGDDVNSSLQAKGGAIDVIVPMQGTTTQNCICNFLLQLQITSWASWSLDYEFASTDGFTKGCMGWHIR